MSEKELLKKYEACFKIVKDKGIEQAHEYFTKSDFKDMRECFIATSLIASLKSLKELIK